MPLDHIHPIWAHLIATLRGHWLPGDARGFRSRDHRIHSSGDYHDPPPPDEHRGLREWTARRAARSMPLTIEERSIVATAFTEALDRHGCRPLILACAPTHVHLLTEVHDRDGLWLLGRAKQLASARLPARGGRVWGRGGGADRLRTMEHVRAALLYIRDHGNDGAAVWENGPLQEKLRLGFGPIRVSEPSSAETAPSNPIRLFVEDSSEAASTP